MNPNDPNVQMLDVVAQRLGDDLCGRLVFVGGAVAGLLITDPAQPAERQASDAANELPAWLGAAPAGMLALCSHAAAPQKMIQPRTALCRNIRKRTPLMPAEQTARLEARLPASVYATLKRAAELQGRSLTDFVVSAAQDAARRAIEDETLIRLSSQDQQRFAEALINPPAPNDALKRAKHAHQASVEVR
jgi:uncharacterized protein (DUF1778 family)